MSFFPTRRVSLATLRSAKIRGARLAIVVDNKDGNGNPGYRVKIKLPWLSEGEATFWARIAVPMAGADRGTYVLPEIDDQVLVVFEHGDIHRPIVIGGLWSKKQEPVEVNQSGKNHTKLIKSRAGHRIIFDDKEGAEKVTIVDKTKKNKIVLDSANKVVKIESDGDIEVIAKANVIIHSNALKIGTTEDVTGKGKSLLTHAVKTFGLKAINGITIGGGNTTINTSHAAACSVSDSGAGELGGAATDTPKGSAAPGSSGSSGAGDGGGGGSTRSMVTGGPRHAHLIATPATLQTSITLTVRVRDDRGPLDGAHVRLADSTSSVARALDTTGASVGDAKVVFAGVKPGAVGLTIEKIFDNFDSIDKSGFYTTDQDFTVTLSPSRLEVHVTDDTPVRMALAGAETQIAGPGGPVYNAVANDSGIASYRNVVPGSYSLEVRKAGFVAKRLSVAVPHPTPGASAHVSIQLTPAAIQVNVQDREKAVGIPNIHVELTPGPLSQSTDAHGDIQLTAAQSPSALVIDSVTDKRAVPEIPFPEYNETVLAINTGTLIIIPDKRRIADEIAAALSISRRALYQKITPRYSKLEVDWDYEVIVVHHSGHNVIKADDLNHIESKHMNDKGFDDIGYHYMIRQSGQIVEGRHIAFKGADVKDANTAKIGILIMGSFDIPLPAIPSLNTTPMPQQLLAAKDLILLLKTKFPKLTKLGGHIHYRAEPTNCPGERLISLLPQLRSDTGLGGPH